MRGKKLSARERKEKLEQDKEYRKQIFKELCDHISKGYSIDCFYALSENTVRTYINRFKEEFCEEELLEAMRKGKDHWEQIGYRQANGLCLGNSRTWYYNMVNRFNWHEKAQIESTHNGEVSVNIVSYASSKPSTSDQSGLQT